MAISSSFGERFDHQQPSAYELQEGISDKFADAHGQNPRDDLLADYAEQVGDTGRESEMVKDDAMTHDMRPPPEIAADVDREGFDTKWQAEQQNARDDLLADYAEQQPSTERDEMELGM